MVKKFCISTLTHKEDKRYIKLDSTIESFIRHTNLPFTKIDWYVYCNGYDDSTVAILNNFIDKYKNFIKFVVVYSNINNGVGYGINRLNELTKDYEYTLFLEDDWVCLHQEDGGVDRNWLINCLNILDNDKSIDCFFLRRYGHIIDMRQTRLQVDGQITNPTFKVKDFDYYIIETPSYSNNPLLRRNSAFFDKKIFPFPEFVNNGLPTEIKGLVNWGQAEIAACKHLKENNIRLKIAFPKLGNFLHFDSNSGAIDIKTLRGTKIAEEFCENYKNGMSGCKFGFLKNVQPHICIICKKETEYNDTDKLFQNEWNILNDIDKIKKDGGDVGGLIDKYNQSLECNKEWLIKKIKGWAGI